MAHYDAQQVCLNGHQINDRYNWWPQGNKNFCDVCGEKTIHQCPSCNNFIKGDLVDSGVLSVGHKTPVPSHCQNCGKPFPWTERQSRLDKSVDARHRETPLLLVEQICSRFHLIARQIKTRHDDRESLIIVDEYDVQDLFHALLHIFFDDIRAEEWTPSYAGGSSRIDFLLKKEAIVIEIKKTREKLKPKQIGDQLLVDIERYKKHPDCRTLVCFVYDPEGWISNSRGLEMDLNREDDDLVVKAIIVPKGY